MFRALLFLEHFNEASFVTAKYTKKLCYLNFTNIYHYIQVITTNENFSLNLKNLSTYATDIFVDGLVLPT